MSSNDKKRHILDGMRYYKKTETQNNMPRFRIRMNEPVDCECLQYAAEKALQRLRLFRMRVVKEEKFLYLQENPQSPVIHQEDGTRHTVCTESNNDHMLWLGYKDSSIYIDFFHGISDGKGVLKFSQTLLYYYCQMKYGNIEAREIPDLLWEETPEEPEEYADCLEFISDEPVAAKSRYEYEKAFQLPDAHMDSEVSCKHYELLVDVNAFDAYVQSNKTSAASVFALFMNRVIADVCGVTEFPIVGAMAVDARRAYSAEKTLQCCVGTIPMWYDWEMAEKTLSEQLVSTKQMILQGIQAENILAGAYRNKKFNEMLAAKFSSLEEKQQYCCQIAERGLERYTYGISTLGAVSFGDKIDEHVKDAVVILCANTSPVILEISKSREVYVVAYCTHLDQDPYVQRLQELFAAEGIPCTCERLDDFYETKAVF